MIILKKAVQDARSDILKNTTWKQSVKEKYYYGVNSIVHFADRNGFVELSQRLVDAYINDPSIKRSTISDRIVFVRIIDRYSGLNLLNKDGRLLNDIEFPNPEETSIYFADKSFPADNTNVLYLISYSLQMIKKIGLSESTYGQYVHAYHCLYPMFLKNDKLVFDNLFVMELIKKNEEDYHRGKIEEWIRKIRRRSLYILMEVNDTGTLRWHIFKEQEKPFGNEIMLMKDEYIRSVRDNNLSDKSLYLHDYTFRKVIGLLDFKNPLDLMELKREDIEEMMKKFKDQFSSRSMETIIPLIKRILQYLHDTGYTHINFAGMILSPNRFKEYNPAVLSKEDELRILENLSSLNSRDQAIMMLAIRYGLRDSDICNLKLEDIDWYADRINIVQSKTDEPLSLPLLDDVGNLIMNYILNDRPRTGIRNIFLTRTRPVRKLESAYGICSKYLDSLNIALQTGSGKGIHVFRYSLVSRLLESKVSHQIITDSLGHSSKESDSYYLSLEEDKLRLCCLDARWIGVKSWR